MTRRELKNIRYTATFLDVFQLIIGVCQLSAAEMTRVARPRRADGRSHRPKGIPSRVSPTGGRGSRFSAERRALLDARGAFFLCAVPRHRRHTLTSNAMYTRERDICICILLIFFYVYAYRYNPRLRNGKIERKIKYIVVRNCLSKDMDRRIAPELINRPGATTPGRPERQTVGFGSVTSVPGDSARTVVVAQRRSVFSFFLFPLPSLFLSFTRPVAPARLP